VSLRPLPAKKIVKILNKIGFETARATRQPPYSETPRWKGNGPSSSPRRADWQRITIKDNKGCEADKSRVSQVARRSIDEGVPVYLSNLQLRHFSR